MLDIYQFNVICAVWILIALITFVFLIFVSAPYGRYARKGWGKMIDNKTGWIIMEMPSFLIILLSSIFTIDNYFARFLASIWLIHYFYRTFIFPFKIHTKGKLMPLSIIISAIAFNGINAFLNGYYLSNFAVYSTSQFFNPWTIIGIALILVGTITHMYSDRILINLRKPGETGYKIPYGFLFEYVSCPNFLGEIVVWIGFFILANNLAALSFLVWTIANVLPRGLKHHLWYKNNFKNYPTNRKAIIPFIL